MFLLEFADPREKQSEEDGYGYALLEILLFCRWLGIAFFAGLYYLKIFAIIHFTSRIIAIIHFTSRINCCGHALKFSENGSFLTFIPASA